MHTSNVSPFIDQNNMILPFQVRFENILKEPNLFFKCRYIIDLIHESFAHNIKEIQNRFVLLVEDIFSVKNQSSFDTNDWKLKSLTRESFPKEFEAICLLLFVDGPMFKLIRHLMSDLNNSYEFPIACLPDPLVQRAMMGSFTSNFFLARMSSQSSLRLNAFEFYMFHFACYITKENNVSNPLSFDSSNIDNTNVLYYILLENYLEYFIPIQIGSSMKSMEIKNPDPSTDAKSSLWKSLSSTTTNFLNLSTLNKTPGITEPLSMMTNSLTQANNRTNNKDLSHGSYSEATTTPRSSVFNSKILTFNRFQQNIPTNFHDGNDMIGSTVYKCETVLAIFSEIWLYDVNNDKHQQIMLLNNFNITIEHIRVVRILIKHLHFFCNSLKNKYGELNSGVGGPHDQTQYNSGGFISGTLNDPLDEIKRNLWSVKYPLHKNLYRFLRMIFDRWPNDSSFRVPLETWLSYIQPWRYVPGKNFNSKELILNDHYDWKRFVSENLFFYTKLFHQVIIRISKQLDLNSAPNSLLVYRVLKVFAQSYLKDWIKEAEMSITNMSDLNMTSYHNRSNMSPNSSLFSTIRNPMSTNLGSNKNSLIDSEPLDSEYVSIFSPGFRDQIIELLFKISRSIYMVEKSLKDMGQNPDAPTTKSWFVEAISNFFMVTNDSSNLNKKNVEFEKIKNHLNASIEYISLIFDIPQQSMETILANARKKNAYNSSLDDNSGMCDENEQSIYKIIDGVPQLTEYGRNQILKGAIKLQNTPKIIEGNPDTQPVRSFEVAFLVKIALFLSNVINRKFGRIFTEYYSKQNIYGTLFRMILSPPVSYTRFEKKGINQKPEIIIENLPPRINLRFIASMDFLFYTCLFAICFKFFHMINHVRTFFIMSLITALVYFICKVTFR